MRDVGQEAMTKDVKSVLVIMGTSRSESKDNQNNNDGVGVMVWGA
jgi:hypothetical protein